MNTLLSLLGRIPGVARYLFFVVLILGLLVFVYFNYGLLATLVILAGCLLVFLVVMVFRRMMKRKERQRGLAFGKALDDAHSGPSREEVRMAVSDLERKWREAIENLRKSNIDLYQLPWYMLIGEPQSGKSTTLKFSGLSFPIGMESISGGGGTRNCDWWFTENGVILDTAGRLTFHDQARPDSAEWNMFLTLLVRHRPFCPINGVILVIPTDALLQAAPEELDARARNISKQLLFIQKQLAIQFPIYLMVTKCDKVYGFVQFFNKLTPDQQREMLGWSAAEADNSTYNPQSFDESFDALVARLEAVRLKHFSRPQYIDDPDKTYTFIEEFRGLKAPLSRYLETIFKPSVYQDPLFFRGYYFSSGMQEGQPIVSACRNMLASQSIIGRLEDIFTKSRAFFVRDFYSEKVFPEEGLVRRASQFQNRDTLKRRIVWASNIVMLVFGLLFVWGLHRDLRSSLSRPMQAIDGVVADLETTDGTFFSSPQDRYLIYGRLSELRTALTSGQRGGFFAWFRGNRNAMTEPLDDTFAYLFLDRFLMGLFANAESQLHRFQLQAPPEPRQSAEELDILLNALKELKRWQVKAFEGSAGEFQPSILPFLRLALNPSWNNELAKLRSDRPLQVELEAWFEEVYQRGSPSVQRFLVEEMVRMSEHLYEDLHQRVLDFYLNQPELANYRDKSELLRKLNVAFEAVGAPSSTWEEHDGKMVDLAQFFDEDHRRQMGASDTYLSFDEIRKRTIESLGPEFTAMTKVGEQSRSNGGFLRSSDNGSKQRAKLAAAIPFVSQLLGVDGSQLGDPRSGIDANGESLTYPSILEDFWQGVLKPYMTEYRRETEAYAHFPEAGKTLEENLAALFESGASRVSELTEILQNNLHQHLTKIKDRAKSRRFESSFNDFFDGLLAYEQDRVSAALARIVAGEDLALPDPPGNWASYVKGVRDRSQNGRDFGGFSRGPDNIGKLFRDHHERKIRTIFVNASKPYEAIDQYRRKVEANLADFYDALMELNGISPTELARNKTRYQDQIPRKRDIQDMAAIEGVPSYLEPHRKSLDAWANGALDAFRQRVRSADPCPQCPSQLAALKKAVISAGTGFPMSFTGQTTLTRHELGTLRAEAKLADAAAVEKVLVALEIYRDPTPLQKSYLRQRGMTDLVQVAQNWAGGVRQWMDGNLAYRYVVRHRDGSRSVADEFAYADLRGAWRGKRKVLINTPVLTAMEKNADAENEAMILLFFNDDTGNRTEARIIFPGGLPAFLAFGLDGRRETPTLVSRPISVRLNVADREATGTLVLETSVALPVPPDWGRLMEN